MLALLTDTTMGKVMLKLELRNLWLTSRLCRILNKFLDNFEEDELPWHESIEPCLSSMMAFISDREVQTQLG